MGAVQGRFDIREGEGSRVAWLSLYSMSNGFFIAFFFSPAYSLFLDAFSASYLAWAYMASAGVGLLILPGFSRVERAVPFSTLLTGHLICLLALILLFWVAVPDEIPNAGASGSAFGGGRWVVFALFVSVVPALSVLDLGFSGLAQRLFDLRQTKRLFGLVGTGGVLASIFGFVSAGVLADRVATKDLLLGAALGLCGSLVFVAISTRRFKGRLKSDRAPVSQEKTPDAEKSFGDRYFWLLGALVLFAIVADYLVDFAFLTEVRKAFPTAEDKTRFVAAFFATVKLLEALLRLVSGKLLSVVGLKVSLLLLPGTVIGILVAALVAGEGTLSDASGLTFMFVLVALGKLVWQVIKKGMFDTSLKVLYQPLPLEKRLSFQANVERVIMVATFVVGLSLLILASRGTALFLVIASMLLVAWIVTVFPLHRTYRVRLREAVERHQAPPLVTSPSEELRNYLLRAPPGAVHNSLQALQTVDPHAVTAQLIEMLDFDEPDVRLYALARLRSSSDPSVSDVLREFSQRTEAPQEREAAQVAMTALAHIARLSGDPESISDLAKSDVASERRQAAKAIGWSSDSELGPALLLLLWDPDSKVRSSAIVAAGQRGEMDLLPRILDHLSEVEFAPAAAHALVALARRPEATTEVLARLDEEFKRGKRDDDVQMRALKIIERIGGPEAHRLLASKLRSTGRTVRRLVLNYLCLAGYRVEEEEAAEAVAVRRAMHGELAEIVGQFAWNLRAIIDLGEAGELEDLHTALEDELADNRASLFLLLSLLCDPHTIELVRESLSAEGGEATVYALEVLDTELDLALKPRVFPLLDELTRRQRLRKLKPLIADTEHTEHRLKAMDTSDRVSAIVHRSYDAVNEWTRACAVEALRVVHPGKVTVDLMATLIPPEPIHPEPMLQELAALALFEADPEGFDEHTARLSRDSLERVHRVLFPNAMAERPSFAETFEHWNEHSIIGRAGLLRTIESFAHLPWELLLDLAEIALETYPEVGANLPGEDDPEGSVYVVVTPEARIDHRRNKRIRLGRSQELTKLVVESFGTPASPATMSEGGRAFRLFGPRFYEVLGDHAELVPAVTKGVDVGTGAAPSTRIAWSSGQVSVVE